jgi:hypothetical protein
MLRVRVMSAPGRVQVSTAGTGWDIVDELHRRCGFEALRGSATGTGHDGSTLVPAIGGEYDHLTSGQLSTRDRRRLTSAGLLSPGGLAADQLADVAGWTGTADEFVAWYCAEGLAGLDQRAAARSGDSWETRERPADETDTAPDPAPADGDLPAPVLEYLCRLVFGDKADYAAAYAYAVHRGGPAPADPGTDWARKARTRIDSITRKVGK